MRILLCTSETGKEAGGLALHCVQLKEIFELLGNEVFVEVLLNPHEFFVVDGGYDSSLSGKIRSSYMLKNIINKYENKIDLCVSCGAGRTAYYSMLFCKKNNIPLTIVLCGSEVNLSYDNPGLAFYNSEALRYASAVVGLSEELNDNAKIICSNSKCRYYVVPNYCDLKKGVKENKTVDKHDIVYATGASFLGEKKGIANLIIAFSKLIHEKQRNDKLYLFGKIDSDIEEKYRQLISDNLLEENVSLCGYLGREEFHNKINEVDVYIQASPFEGYGNSVAEAIGEGKDILISDTGYLAETIKEEFPGHIIRSLAPSDMADSLYDYAENIFVKNEAEKIREYLADKLSKESVVAQWKDIISKIPEKDMQFKNGICNAVMFHDVDNSYTGIDYNKDGFRKLLRSIYDKGIRLCSARDYFAASIKDNLVVCTFDDGYENVFNNALPVMKELGFTATVYICPDLIGKNNDWNHKDEINRWHMTHDMLMDLVSEGWEIGSHGLSHINLRRLSESELDINLIESKKMLEQYGNIESFCYPYGSFNEFIKTKVGKYYKNAFSVSIGGNNVEEDLFQIIRMTPEELKRRLEVY